MHLQVVSEPLGGHDGVAIWRSSGRSSGGRAAKAPAAVGAAEL